MPTAPTKKPRAKKAGTQPAPDSTVVAFKAFNKDLTCRDHQFAIGQTYTVEGAPVICENGFHACENPLDVLNYYDLCDSRFARVTLTGAVDRKGDDSKVCAASITIDAELSLHEWIGLSIKWLLNAASGYYSQLAASGDYSQLAAPGYSSQLAASGDSSKLAASGDSSKLAASGDSSKLEVTGENSAAAAVGPDSRIKAATGTPIAICEYDRTGRPLGFAAGIAGIDEVPADTWLTAKDGKLVPVGVSE